jgi:RNA polymerase sigma-70 factor (ECF subfamily)
MTDSQIIELYFNRDESAISQSDVHYGAYCRKISMNILHSRQDCEECVNDTWHRAWNSIPPTKPSSLAAFFGKIVRNLSISRYRKNKSAKRFDGIELLLSDFDDCIPSNESVVQTIESKMLAEIINDWLAKLDKTDRVLFVRRYWFGESVKSLRRNPGAHKTKSRRLC